MCTRRRIDREVDILGMYIDTEQTIIPARGIVRVNRFLSLLAVVFGLYLVFQPLLPQLHFYMFGYGRKDASTQEHPAVTPRTAQAVNADAGVELVPSDNRLQIKTIGVDGTVFEGRSVTTLSKGIWRRPLTSTPDKGGNTVFVAHRYLYRSGPNTFYLLDKVGVGDDIAVWWKGVKYTYTVSEVSVVNPDATDIEKPTADTRLTLYTCTPLFSSAKRLVVIAKPKTTTAYTTSTLNQ